MVADGRVHSATTAIRYDNRVRRRLDRGGGWVIEAEIMQAFGGDLNFTEVNSVLPDSTRGPPIMGLPTLEATFTKGFLDVRRYNEIGDARLNIRLADGVSLINEILTNKFLQAL